jgi:hypothetical protein
MEVIAHYAIRQHLHSAKSRHFPDLLAQNLLLSLSFQKEIPTDNPRHAMVNRTLPRHLDPRLPHRNQS